MPNSNPNENNTETAADLEAFSKAYTGTTPTEQPSTQAATSNDTSYTEQVNKLIAEVTTNEKGKLVYPDDTPDHLKFAVAAEKKFRDTQSGFTKASTELKELDAEAVALREQVVKLSKSTTGIPEERAQELEDLMYTDPKAWREEMNKLETTQFAESQANLNEQMSEVRKKAGATHELERRQSILDDFNSTREVKVTAELLADRIPPFIGKKLESGEITFGEFLSESVEYLEKGRTVANPADTSTTDINSVGGSQGGATNKEESQLDYSGMTF